MLLSLNLLSQNINVESFRQLPNDLSARDNQVLDQNGNISAILKVVTPHTDFEWEPDRMGIVKTERRTGEYWLYLPRGAQRLTIKHDQLGILRNFQYPLPIEAAMVYEMVLTTAYIEIVVRERKIQSQWLAINTTPEGANVFINDQMVGTTPFSRRYPEGTYTYRIEMPRYHSEAGRVELRGDRHLMELNLRPRYGNIEVVSAPESGMQIFLNGENTGLTTPATLQGVSSGEQSVRLQGQWYQPQTQNVTVSDNQITMARFTMQPAFANVTIRTEPRADILIDGARVGSGTHNTRMLEGLYEVSARLDKHHPARQQLQIEAGRDREITLSLQAQTGHLDITSAPFNARITLNGEQRGTTPATIRDILVGDYTVALSLDGHATVFRNVTIKEGQTTEINETLPRGLPITITSQPAGAELTIAGRKMGTTPWSGALALGSQHIRLVNQSKIVEETISIAQGGQTRWEFDVREFPDFTETTANLNLEMIAVRGGTFTMGCTSEQGRNCRDDESPTFQAKVSDYYIGKYPVTQRQWRAIMGNNPSTNSGCDDCPVTDVSWNDAQEFIRKLNQQTGKRYRLPTEAEWEFAARGGTQSRGFKYSGSNNIGDVAWYTDNSGGKTQPVSRKRANELGIHDMSGNVWEWCGDWFGSYTSTAKTNPTGPATGSSRVLRGGSWINDAGGCRGSFRGNLLPDNRRSNLGFRLALVP